MVKKSLIVLIFLAIVLTLLGLAAIWCVKPVESLDLNYEPLSLADKFKEMLQTRSLELRLTERDLNNLVKQELAARKRIRPDLEIEGARLEQHGGDVTAFVNLKAYGKIDIGSKLAFKLEWNPPHIVVRHVGTEVRSFAIPASQFRLDPISIDIENGLPSLIAVKDVRFTDDGIHIMLKLNR